jgi:flagellar basal-body rod modification protein FlgD
MFLEAISGAAAGGQKSATDRQGMADNFDAFLMLLTTQLKHQNPLDPLDTNEFTQQLVQFAGVEQSIRQNENLENLIKVSTANAALSAASFVGMRVNVESTTTTLANGGAEWTYKSNREAASATFTVRNEAGETVWQESGSFPPGRHTFKWTGHTMDGHTAPDGKYRLTIEAADASGGVVDVGIEVTAEIDGVDFSGDEPILLVGDKGIPLGDVKSVTAP